MLAKNLVIELSEYKINVNAIAPGATLTERTMQDPAYNKTWSRITPMGRPAHLQKISPILPYSWFLKKPDILPVRRLL